jgi:hypothetical protein
MAQPDETSVWFHGTSLIAGLSLLNGAALRLEVALAQKIDGRPGFYLVNDADVAAFFAARRVPGAILRVTISAAAGAALLARGGRITGLPQGAFPVPFPGEQFFLPPKAFASFNRSRRLGMIALAPHNFR